MAAQAPQPSTSTAVEGHIVYTSDGEHQLMDDEDSTEELEGDYGDDDDGSSSLEIPNDSIDFDVVYSLRHFVATIDGQASVSKGDAMCLMDDSNSYWWLVRVLRSEEIGYIPAENIETPIERLARLNKHRNVDLASATQAERDGPPDFRARKRLITSPQHAAAHPHTTRAARSKSVVFAGDFTIHNYPPAVWDAPAASDVDGDAGDEESWDEEDMQGESEGEGMMELDGEAEPEGAEMMEPDDGIGWAEGAEPGPVVPNAGGAARVQIVVGPDQAPVVVEPEAKGVDQRAQLGLGLASTLRTQTSRERITTLAAAEASQDQLSVSAESGVIDPAISMAPEPAPAPTNGRQLAPGSTAARVAAATRAGPGPSKPSAIMEQQRLAQQQSQQAPQAVQQVQQPQQQQQPLRQQRSTQSLTRSTSDASSSAGKRSRDDSGPEPETTPKRAKPDAPRKLRKEPSEDFRERQADGGEKKKKGGMFGGLFGRKKDKEKEKEKGKEREKTRERKDSGTGAAAAAAGGAPHKRVLSNDSDSFVGRSSGESGSQYTASPPESKFAATPQSQRRNAASARVQQLDKEQQARYQQQYLRSANRPGSLILANTSVGGGEPATLSVLRVFAGSAVRSEATFKTVLLNGGTTSAELIRQALQRFRLPADEAEDYYLTVKAAEGEEAVLRAEEKPLGVFEELSAAYMPSVKRSSIASINSLASNLSAHPAIARLGMGDFTDDSAVKFYLNRRADEADGGAGTEESDALSAAEDAVDPLSPRLTPERFSASSARFALQTVIHPEDLPDGLVFDPHTEAIVPRASLVPRGASHGVSQTERKKVFVFAKNATVAEVIETSLERFGIAEGVVDGGDDVEDRVTKRRSGVARVRYGLAVEADGEERGLHPSSKIIDAFVRQPAFRLVDRRSASGKPGLAEPQADDVAPDDPVFVLRRAGGSAGSRRHSRHGVPHGVPLDDLALAHKRASSTSDAGTVTQEKEREREMSQKEIIAAQRAASRANQRAMLTAQSNSEQGVDLLLPDRSTLRSARSPGADDRVRYSYIQPDGETYDISDIIEEEWRPEGNAGEEQEEMEEREDLLHGVLQKARGRGERGVLEERLDRVLSRVKGNNKAAPQHLQLQLQQQQQQNRLSASSVRSGSMYSEDQPLSPMPASPRSPTSPKSPDQPPRSPTKLVTSYSSDRAPPSPTTGSGSGRSTPTDARKPAGPRPHQRQQPSIASIMSDLSTYDGEHERLSSTPATPNTPATSANAPTPARPARVVLKGDMGLGRMLALIELAARAPPKQQSVLSPAEALLFGPRMDVSELHPAVRDLFEPHFAQMEEYDKRIDRLLGTTRIRAG